MKKNKKNLLKKLFEIYEGCKVKRPSKKRDLSNRFVVWNILIKYITFLPAYFFNRIKISPDLITFTSFLFVPLGSYFIISEKIILGATCWALFGALDSLDGDMVRLSKRRTFYGETLDSLGADIFYFLTPATIGFYLYNYNLNYENSYSPSYFIIIGFLTSFFLIFTRYMGSKRYILSLINPKNNKKFYSKKKISNLSKINSKFSILENEILRGNLFAEPGMILNYFIIFYFNQIKILEWYLIILFAYYFVIFLKRTVASIIYFSNIE